ncbi:MAG: hypothetical protein ACM3KM_02890 [Acidobacteriaceae bacterium]
MNSFGRHRIEIARLSGEVIDPALVQRDVLAALGLPESSIAGNLLVDVRSDETGGVVLALDPSFFEAKFGIGYVRQLACLLIMTYEVDIIRIRLHEIHEPSRPLTATVEERRRSA